MLPLSDFSHFSTFRGPDNCDVFDNASVIKMRTNLPVESPDIVSMEKLIKKLLDQPIEPSCDGPDACPPPELSVVQETLPLTAEGKPLSHMESCFLCFCFSVWFEERKRFVQ